VVICLKRGADLHIALLMPLPLTVSCISKIQIGFTFLVLAHPGSPRKTAVKRVCVCVLRSISLLQLAVICRIRLLMMEYFVLTYVASSFVFQNCIFGGSWLISILHCESKKTRHLTLAHNFTKYWPIFKILSLLDSVRNL